MKKLLFLTILLLAGCSSTKVDVNAFYQNNYGQECINRPYTEHRDDNTLCLTQALAKEWSQNKLTNSYINKK